MPILPNPRHERFAQLVASGVGVPDAYRQAGYKATTAASAQVNGNRLIKNRLVVDRVYHIRVAADEEALRLAGFSKGKVLSLLYENVNRAMQLQPVLNAKGEPTGEHAYNGPVANRALELLGKELGMFVDRTNATVTVKSLADLPDEDLVAILAQAEQAKPKVQ